MGLIGQKVMSSSFLRAAFCASPQFIYFWIPIPHNVIFLVNGFLALIKISTFGRKKIAFLGLRNLTFCRG